MSAPTESDFEPHVIASNAVVSLEHLAPAGRLSLRVRDACRGALTSALGVELPSIIGSRSTTPTIDILKLGPDEWQILADESEALRVRAACAQISQETPHSLTDISDREITLRIGGPKAPELLTLGCPRDLNRLVPGNGCRTVIDDVTVVLWRDAADCFRIEVGRSFAPHLIELLRLGCAELAAE